MIFKRMLIAALTSGMLAGSVGGAVAQDDSSATDVESFRTRQIEPGVLRVLDDNAGHDLTRKWPQKRRDIDHITVGPDGNVWLSITAAGPDNDRLDGARLWPLGQQATYGPKDGLGQSHGRLFFDEQGLLWLIGDMIGVFDGEEWSSTKAKRMVVGPDGTVWLAGSGLGVESWDGTSLTKHLESSFTDRVFASPDGTVGVFGWNGVHLFDGSEWSFTSHGDPRRASTTDGTLAVVSDGPNGLRLFRDDESATVLKGNRLNEVAAAPDGSLWLAGNVGKGNGGVYRVDPSEVFAARAADAAPAAEEDAEADEEAA